MTALALCIIKIRYTTSNNSTIFKPLIECYNLRYLSIQPDFLDQKCEIEEVIKNFAEGQYYKVLYYPKSHCELNHIEHYWCHCKAYARHHCDYSLERRVSEALQSVDNEKILVSC